MGRLRTGPFLLPSILSPEQNEREKEMGPEHMEPLGDCPSSGKQKQRAEQDYLSWENREAWVGCLWEFFERVSLKLPRKTPICILLSTAPREQVEPKKMLGQLLVLIILATK